MSKQAHLGCLPVPYIDHRPRCAAQLEQRGVIAKGSGGEGMDSVEDQELLMQVMEAREALENAHDEAQLQALRQANQLKAERNIQVRLLVLPLASFECV